MDKRLQFRHNDTLFATKEIALNYLSSQMLFAENKIALTAEPIVLKYGTDEKNPNIILAIGSYGDGVTSGLDNKYFIIDTASIQSSIEELRYDIEHIDLTVITDAIADLVAEDAVLDGKITDVLTALQAEVTRAEAAETQIVADMTALVEAEKTRATNAENALAITVVDTNSINLTSTPSVTGNTISADIKLATSTGNQLQVMNDPNGGLYYNVNMAYQTGSDNSILDLLVNGLVVASINLPLERFLQEAHYDSGTKTLVFTFSTEGGGTEVVNIPIGDLVDEYTAGLGLSLDTNNVFSIKYNSGASEPFLVINANGIAIQGVQTAIDAGVTTERNRALAAEQTETDARTAADTALQTNITAERDRAMGVEQTLNNSLTTVTNNLAAEITRATNEEQRLDTKIDDVEEDLTHEITLLNGDVNDLRIALTAEVARAEAGEAAAVVSAKTYTDTEIAITKLAVTSEIGNALTQAKDYADTKDLVLAAEIARVDNKSILATSSDPTALVMTANRETNGNVTINGDLRLSTTGKNTIVIKSDGLSAEFDLQFSNGTLDLISPNHGVVASTNIAIGGLIQDISYNASTYQFTIVFKLDDGTTQTETIDMSGLVRTWVIDNNVVGGDGRHTAVDLYLAPPTPETQGKERLYAEALISPNNVYGTPNYTPVNNLLAKHTDSSTQNGYLYVDGLAKFVKMDNGDTLESTVTNIKDKVTTIEGEAAQYDIDIASLQGNVITSGIYQSAVNSLVLNKSNGNTIVITGFTDGAEGMVEEAPLTGLVYGRKSGTWVQVSDGLSGNLSGITPSIVGNVVILTDSSGRTVNMDLTPIINTAVTQALTEVFKPTRFLEAVSDETQINVVVNETNKTVTFGFGENATLNAGTY